MALADQIRRRRLEQDLSLAELARQAKVSKAYLHQLENSTDGKRPSADVLYKIAFALGASVGELLEKRIAHPDLEVTDVPDALRRFALERGLPEADIKMLAGISYRGERPKTPEDWAYVYDSIRRSVVTPAE
jgi:transcriptional regulator with XRE-family HTH domain